VDWGRIPAGAIAPEVYLSDGFWLGEFRLWRGGVSSGPGSQVRPASVAKGCPIVAEKADQFQKLFTDS